MHYQRASSMKVLIILFLLGVVNGLPNGLLSTVLQKSSSNSDHVSSFELTNCTIHSHCWQNGSPPQNISCVKGACLCTGCFTVNATSGVCQVKQCFDYSNDTCSDNRKSQLTSFLLTFFLSGIGVGNFYIGEWELGVIQVSLFVYAILSTCCCCCVTSCLSEESRETWTCICCFSFMMLVVFLNYTAVFGWWLADLIYIGLDQKYSSDGCSLKHNL